MVGELPMVIALYIVPLSTVFVPILDQSLSFFELIPKLPTIPKQMNQISDQKTPAMPIQMMLLRNENESCRNARGGKKIRVGERRKRREHPKNARGCIVRRTKGRKLPILIRNPLPDV